MSLLADLTLAYETLADDPIEMGIHYGKSILHALSPSSSSLVPSSHPKESSSSPVSFARAASHIQINRTVRRSAVHAETPRASYLNYAARRPVGYTQRNLVGAL